MSDVLSNNQDSLEVTLRERPLTLEDKHRYVVICGAIGMYNLMKPKRLTEYSSVAATALKALKARDNVTLSRVRSKLDEAHSLIVNAVLHGESLPK